MVFLNSFDAQDCSINQLHLCTKKNPKYLIYLGNPLCIRKKKPNPKLISQLCPTKPTQSSSTKTPNPKKTCFWNNASEMRPSLHLESWKYLTGTKGGDTQVGILSQLPWISRHDGKPSKLCLNQTLINGHPVPLV